MSRTQRQHAGAGEARHDLRRIPGWHARSDRPTRAGHLRVLDSRERALSNVGDLYHARVDNCEHDMTFGQTGIPSSPTVNTILGVGALLGLGALIANQSKPRPRRRRYLFVSETEL
jgi:hypothetical protein